MSKRIFTTYLMALLGLFLTAMISYAFYSKETQSITVTYKLDFEEKINILNREINDKISILKTIRNFYLSSELVTAEEFDFFTKDIIFEHKDIRVLEWVPRILHENREQVEKEWQAYHSSFEITQKSEKGTLSRAYYKDEYYPVYYLNPMRNNEEAFGFDLSSEEKRKKTLELSRDSGKILATTTLEFIQDNNEQKSLLVFVPVYKQLSYTIKNRRENIRGFIVGVFKISDFVLHSFERFSNSELGLKIVDTTNFNEIIYEYKPMEFDLVDFNQRIKMDLNPFAGRKWSVEITPTIEYYKSRRSIAPYVILVMGFCFVIVGTIYTLLILNYAINIETKINAKSDKLVEANQRLELISKTDGLTQVANRRYFDDFYKRECRRALRESTSISVIMIDIDFFKNYNDSYGHLEGDNCLKEVASALSLLSHRATDLLARYGGEEFVMVLPDTKDAVSIANKCVESIENLQIPHNKSDISNILTISAGVCTITATNINEMDELLERADTALYKAKELGRNQVVVST